MATFEPKEIETSVEKSIDKNDAQASDASKLSDVAADNDFARAAREQAQEAVNAGSSVAAADKEVVRSIEQTSTVTEGAHIAERDAAYQMEATLTSKKLFDQNPPTIMREVGSLSGTSDVLNAYLDSASFTPTMRHARAVARSYGRPPNMYQDRTSHMQTDLLDSHFRLT